MAVAALKDLTWLYLLALLPSGFGILMGCSAGAGTRMA